MRSSRGTIKKSFPVDVPNWMPYAVLLVYFTPGWLLGLGCGKLIIKPVNAALGWVFRGFNQIFDRMTEFYGKTVGHVLRLAVIVCIAYGGLLILTAVQFIRAPTGFIPQQDKGYLILNVQLPDAASVDRTEQVMAQIEKLIRPNKKENRPGIPGIAHTVGVSGQSLILNANAPNLGSMYIMLDPFEKRHDSSRSADAIAAKVREICAKEVDEAGVSTSAARLPIPG